MKKTLLSTWIVLSLFVTGTAHANINLVDKNDWKADLYGFVDIDMTQDSTRSFTEIAGNSPVARTNSVSGDNGRVQSSLRNSRLGFLVQSPETNGWKSKGVLEMDFFGFEESNPNNSAAPTISETSWSQNPNMRLRHAYMQTDKNGTSLFAGQKWTLFGWQPVYFPAIVSVAPEAAELFQRTAQFGAIQKYTLNDTNSLEVGVTVERPSQKDSGMPNVDLGVRYTMDGLKTVVGSTYGDYKVQPMSIALTSTFRQFETYQFGGTTSSQNKQYTQAVAADALIPIMGNTDVKSAGNSLSITGEYTNGTGYADSLVGYTGGLTGATYTATTSSFNGTNLDSGYGIYDANGNFNMIQFTTYNVALQYILPTELRQMINVGASQLSTNLNSMTLVGGANGVPALTSVYDKVGNTYVNYFVDFNEQIRVAAEVSFQSTHYVGDGMTTGNNRAQITAVYHF